MVNRTKISKEISRAAGGASQISKTGEGTTLKQIQDDRHKWEVDPTRSSGRPGGTRYRLKKEYKEEQRKSLKNGTSPRVVSATPKKNVKTTKEKRSPFGFTKKDIPLPAKKRTAKPMGIGKEDLKKAKIRRGSIRAIEKLLGRARGDKAREKVYSARGRTTPSVEIQRLLDPDSTEDPSRAGLYKKGGKVSRRKGGTVSRWKGGNLEVSQFYDK
jgi:hypothetical protein